MRQWIDKNKELLTIIFTVIAIGLSCASFYKSCSTDSKLEMTNYAISSIEHRPRIKLSNPQIHTLTLTSDSIPVKKSTDEADSIGNLSVKIKMQVKIRATNIGNSTAKIIGWVIADTLSNDPFLKQLIKDRPLNNAGTNNELKFPHLYQDLTPLDSCYIELVYNPQWITNNKFIIHVIVFYENEIEQLFDTYYWITVQTNEIVFPNPTYYRNNSLMLKKFQSEILKTVIIKDENNYSSIYSEDQKINLIKNLNQ